VMFSKKNCGECDITQEYFNEYKAPFTMIKVDDYEHLEGYDDFRKELRDSTGAKQFPIVFIDGKYVGGLRQVMSMSSTNKLADLYKEKKDIEVDFSDF
jgi:glutaredoxin